MSRFAMLVAVIAVFTAGILVSRTDAASGTSNLGAAQGTTPQTPSTPESRDLVLDRWIGRTVLDAKEALSLTETAPVLSRNVFWRSRAGKSYWTTPLFEDSIIEIVWCCPGGVGDVVIAIELVKRRGGGRVVRK